MYLNIYIYITFRQSQSKGKGIPVPRCTTREALGMLGWTRPETLGAAASLDPLLGVRGGGCFLLGVGKWHQRKH